MCDSASGNPVVVTNLGTRTFIHSVQEGKKINEAIKYVYENLIKLNKKTICSVNPLN